MNPTGTLILYCALIAVAAWVGAWAPTRFKLGHTRLELIMSFVSGLMLGVALLHMLPHAAHQMHSLRSAVEWMLGGILAMFLLIRVFGTHAHGDDQGHGDDHGHGHQHKVSWVGVLVGLTIHSLLDGVALAAAVTTATRYADPGALVAIAPFLAILLHKPIDSLAIVSVMAAGGWSERSRKLVGLCYALAVPLGALLFYAGIRNAGGEVLGASLAFSAGLFLCISLADLLPEIQFHHHDRVKLTAALLIGVLCAYGVGKLESGTREIQNPLLRRGMQERQLN